MCKTFSKMSALIGDFTLASKIDEAALLLDREIMMTPSLYFE
jgi:hypothetical protein